MYMSNGLTVGRGSSTEAAGAVSATGSANEG